METNELCFHWRFRVHRIQIAHYDSARKFERLHLWLGFPAIVLSTIVGTSVFASLQKTANANTGAWLAILIGLLSILSASLTGLQTFLRYSELAERHRIAAARFISLKHRIELLATLPPPHSEAVHSTLKDIEPSWAKLREESPNIPQKIWGHVEQKLTYEEHAKRYSHFGNTLPSAAPSAGSKTIQER
jgi:hypothetical protein